MMWDDFEWCSREEGFFLFGPNPDDLTMVVFRMVGDEAQGLFEGKWAPIYWLTDIVSQNMSSRPA